MRFETLTQTDWWTGTESKGWDNSSDPDNFPVLQPCRLQSLGFRFSISNSYSSTEYDSQEDKDSCVKAPSDSFAHEVRCWSVCPMKCN